MIVFIWIIGTRDVRSAPPRWKMGCPAPQKLTKLIEKADSLFHRVCPHFEKKGRAFPFWILYSPRIPDERYHLRCFYSVLKMSIYPTALAQTFYLYVVLITDLATIKYWQLRESPLEIPHQHLTSLPHLASGRFLLSGRKCWFPSHATPRFQLLWQRRSRCCDRFIISKLFIVWGFSTCVRGWNLSLPHPLNLNHNSNFRSHLCQGLGWLNIVSSSARGTFSTPQGGSYFPTHLGRHCQKLYFSVI